jgi:hypothetical protein
MAGELLYSGTNWPETRDIVLPRDPSGRQPDKIAFILGLAAAPWSLVALANLLRDAGEVEIPRKAEAEMAAALHWTIGLVLRGGAEDWEGDRLAAIRDLEGRAAERLKPKGAA